MSRLARRVAAQNCSYSSALSPKRIISFECASVISALNQFGCFFIFLAPFFYRHLKSLFGAACQPREWSRRLSVRETLKLRFGNQFSTGATDSIDGLIIGDFFHIVRVDSHHENTHEFVAAQFPLELRKFTGKSIYGCVQQ